MTEFFVRLVNLCALHARIIVLLALAAVVGLGFYVTENIAINTDIDQLMAKDLTWRKKEREMAQAFPQNNDRLVIVVDSPSPDLAEYAASTLSEELGKRRDLFKSVSRPDSHPYFMENGLLFLSEKELSETLETIIKAQPMLGSLAADPSLRGLFSTLQLAASGIRQGEARYEDMAPSFDLMAKTITSAIEGQFALLPWQSMFSSRSPSLRETRKFITTQPVLDFSSLSPGKKASSAIRQISSEKGLTPENGVSIRLTGSVALNDEEFASVAQGAEFATLASLALVMLLLFFALKSMRLILPIIATLVAGLIATTAFALAAIGSLNLISVAFAVMFVGIAVDFGIQFGIRYREMRHFHAEKTKALLETARGIAAPLGLAAASTILGFAAFVPTDYRGVAELGLIAAAGMAIAFLLNMTLLPALLSLFNPPPEPQAIGYAWAEPIEDFLVKHRKRFLFGIGVVALCGLALATQTRFDFDPLNLKDPDSESVATLFDIMKEPEATPYTIQILAPSLSEADALASRIGKLDVVDHTITLSSFVPDDQEPKLSLIEDAKFMLDPSLNPLSTKPAPSDDEIYATLQKTADTLNTLQGNAAEAKALAQALQKIIDRRDPKLLSQLDKTMIDGIKKYLSRLRAMLGGRGAGIDSINEALRSDWITKDDRAKIEVYPKGDARDHKTLEAFTKAVREIAPDATGAPISIQESGKTIMGAFTKAGILALVFITLLLGFVLRRIDDVLRTLAPLILAGILTLATMACISLPLNFANVIALPLLLSLGVSYAIYFVTYWRSGQDRPLSSGMARAVLFSAATTLVAFFSLSFSSHTGTRGMGQLLTISLLYCLLCSFLLLPVLLGRRQLS